jgi:hypothetical protein
MLKINDHVRFHYLECESFRQRNDSKTVISGGRDDQGELSHAKFGTLHRFSKEPAELPSLHNGCNQIAQDHSRTRSAQLNKGILMGAKEFSVAPPYLLKVLRALP